MGLIMYERTMKTEYQPKPCPKCGSNKLRYEFVCSQGFILCETCGAEGPDDERASDPICDMDAAWRAWESWDGLTVNA